MLNLTIFFQVHLRAKEFFEDLCQSLHQLVLDRDNNCVDVPTSGGGIKRRRNTSSSTVDQVFPETSPPTDNILTPSSPSQHANSGSARSPSGLSGAASDSLPDMTTATTTTSTPTTTTSSQQHVPTSQYTPTVVSPPRDLQHNCLPPPSTLTVYLAPKATSRARFRPPMSPIVRMAAVQTFRSRQFSNIGRRPCQVSAQDVTAALMTVT